MINEFWGLVLETWEQGIRGIGIDDIIIIFNTIDGGKITKLES